MRHMTNHETPRFWETTRCNSTLELLRGIVFLVKFHHLAMEKCCIATRLADMIPATLEPATLDMWTLEFCLSDGMSSSRMADEMLKNMIETLLQHHAEGKLSVEFLKFLSQGLKPSSHKNGPNHASLWSSTPRFFGSSLKLLGRVPTNLGRACVDMIGFWGSSSFDTNFQIN